MFEIENGDTPFMDHSTVDTKVFFFTKSGRRKLFSFSTEYVWDKEFGAQRATTLC